MAYDDTPYYIRNNPNLLKKEQSVYFSNKSGTIGQPSARLPSPNYLWWHEEKAKRLQGIMNEIDINEIGAALRGYRNDWFLLVKENKKLFDDFLINPTKEVWETIKVMKK